MTNGHGYGSSVAAVGDSGGNEGREDGRDKGEVGRCVWHRVKGVLGVRCGDGSEGERVTRMRWKG